MNGPEIDKFPFRVKVVPVFFQRRLTPEEEATQFDNGAKKKKKKRRNSIYRNISVDRLANLQKEKKKKNVRVEVHTGETGVILAFFLKWNVDNATSGGLFFPSSA